MAELVLREDRDGLTILTLNRPEKLNALTIALFQELRDHVEAIGADDAVRCVVLRGAGKCFSAGNDLADIGAGKAPPSKGWHSETLRMMEKLPKPVIARVQGAAFGGGVGLVACCDIAIGSPRASFCLSEVKLGIIPSAISPYVVDAIGARAARRYFQTAERFDAAKALELGLLHDVVEEDALDGAIDGVIQSILSVGPIAAREAKDLVFAVNRPITPQVIDDTVHRIARLRATPEAKEGMAAFFEKRSPAWKK